MWTGAAFASIGEMFDKQATARSTFMNTCGVIEEIVSKNILYSIQIRFDFMMMMMNRMQILLSTNEITRIRYLEIRI